MKSDWSAIEQRPEVLTGLLPVLSGPVATKVVQDLATYVMCDSNGKPLLPPPHRMAVAYPYVLFFDVEDESVVSARSVHIDELLPPDFLNQVKQQLSPETELAWAAQAGLEYLRRAFLEAFRLRKLQRTSVFDDTVQLEWPFYGLDFCLNNITSVPNVTLVRQTQ